MSEPKKPAVWPPLAAPTGSERLNRRVRLCQAMSVLVGIEAKVVVEAVAAQMPDASVFWDVTDRQVEIVGDDFEVIVRERQRQSPNATGITDG